MKQPTFKERLKRHIINYFEFSRGERNGSIALVLLCLGAYLAPEIGERFRGSEASDFAQIRAEIAAWQASTGEQATLETVNRGGAEAFAFDPNSATFEDFVQLGLSERTANTILNYREHGGRFFKPDDFQKIYGLPAADFNRLRPFIEIENLEREDFKRENRAPARRAEYFTFDPNAASADDFERLGLPPRTALSIVHYREKGGVFRQKTDFKKIYTLAEDDYRRLEAYIDLPDAPRPGESPPRPVMYAGVPMPEASRKNAEHKPAQALDINQSSAEDWEQLPGIGAARAQRILYFREKLGGFASVEQVAESRGLPDSVFRAIEPMLVFRSPVFKKIGLNSASADDFGAHPYFDKRHASLIVSYRAQHGPFKTLDELGKIGAFKDKNWLEKVKPYLSLE